MLDNQATKYYRNIETPGNLLYDYNSQEGENKIRIDRNFMLGDFVFSAGTNFNYAKYTNNSTIKSVNQSGLSFDLINSDLKVFQYGFYVQTAHKFFDNKVQLSLGCLLYTSRCV